MEIQWPGPNRRRYEKKIQKNSILEKIVENYISHYIAWQRNSVYFLSNVSGCARITAFPNTLIAKNWKRAFPRIAALPITLIAKNWNLIELPFSHFFKFHNIFFYTQIGFVFQFLRVSYIVHDHILAFLFFSSSVRFWNSHHHIDDFFMGN